MGRLIRVAIAAAAAAVVLATAGGGSAFTIGARPWPGHVITYYNGVPDQRTAVLTAVAAWNASGVNVRFRPASRGAADLVIDPVPLNYPDIGEARATMGYMSRAATTLDPYPKLKLAKDGRPIGVVGVPKAFHGAHLWMRHAHDPFVSKLADADVAEIVAHELGHVLGLGHSKARCAVMRPAGIEPDRCGFAWYERYCGILALDDIRGAAKLYGGAPAAGATRLCQVAAPVASPASLTAIVDRDLVTLRWKVPPGANGKNAAALLGAFVRRGPGDACPTTAPVVKDGVDFDAEPRGPYTDQLAPGTYCYSVWLARINGQRSARPATVKVTIVAEQ